MKETETKRERNVFHRTILLIVFFVASLMAVNPSLAVYDGSPPLAYYAFNTTGDFSDSTGNLSNLTNNGASFVAGGKLGGAYNFSKSESDYMTLTDTTHFDDIRSISVWVKASSEANDDAIFSFADENVANYWLLHASEVSSGAGWFRTRLNKGSPVEWDDTYDSGTTTVGVWSHWVVTMGANGYEIWRDGVQVDDGAETLNDDNAVMTTVFDLLTLGARELGGGVAEKFYDGIIDDLVFFDYQLNSTQVGWLYNSGSGCDYLCINPPVNVTDPFATVVVYDKYDNSTISGLTVYIGTTSNTTDGSGAAIVYNPTGLNFTVDGGALYFNVSGTAVENETKQAVTYGAFVDVQLYDVSDNQVTTFNLSSGTQENQTTTGTLKIYLSPNTSNSVTATAPNYANLITSITTTGRDTGSYNISGIGNATMNITAVNTTGGAVNTFTINYSGILSGSQSTTTGNVTLPLTLGEYTFIIDSTGFAFQNVTLDLINTTTTYEFVLPPPYINFTFSDEQNETLLNGTNISVSLIGTSSATNYTVSTGVLYLENLAADNYTIRYFAPNYGVREYYVNYMTRTNRTDPLFLIIASDSTLLPVTVTDFEGRQLDGAVVHWQRFYTSQSAYVSVEMTTTSASGESNLYFEPADAWYKPILYYQGFARTDIDGRRYTTADASDGVIFRIDITENPYESWLPISGLIASNEITHSAATREVSYTFSDTANIISELCLNVYSVGRRVETLVNSTCTSLSSATVVTTYPLTNNTIRARVELETNTANSPYTAAILDIESFVDSTISVFGSMGLFVASLFTATMALLSGAHPAFPIMFGLIGLLGAWLGLSLGIGTTSIIMVCILGVGIIMLMSWRFNR